MLVFLASAPTLSCALEAGKRLLALNEVELIRPAVNQQASFSHCRRLE